MKGAILNMTLYRETTVREQFSPVNENAPILAYLLVILPKFDNPRSERIVAQWRWSANRLNGDGVQIIYCP